MLTLPVETQLIGDVDWNGVDVVESAFQMESTNAPFSVVPGFFRSLAEYMSATVPATTGAAMDVPIS